MIVNHTSNEGRPLRRALTTATLALALGVAACGGDEPEAAADTSGPLRVGASPVPHAEILEQAESLLAAEGVQLEIVTFTDYVQPNLALDAGELEANYFQTVPYLEQFNRDHGTRVVSVAAVHVEPMGLYSRKVPALAELARGATVAIPNDPVNTGRALLLLQSAGLLTLNPGVGIEATPLDLAANPRELQFRELESAQLPRSLPDVDAAVINTNYALEAGLSPQRDALAIEGPDSPHANILAVRAGRESDPRVQALARVLAGPEIARFIRERYQGAVVPGSTGAADSAAAR